MLARQLAHQRALSNRRKANEANGSNTGSGYIEAGATTTSASGRREQLSLKLGQLGLELTQMISSGFVLLGLGHLSVAAAVVSFNMFRGRCDARCAVVVCIRTSASISLI